MLPPLFVLFFTLVLYLINHRAVYIILLSLWRLMRRAALVGGENHIASISYTNHQ